MGGRGEGRKKRVGKSVGIMKGIWDTILNYQVRSLSFTQVGSLSLSIVIVLTGTLFSLSLSLSLSLPLSLSALSCGLHGISTCSSATLHLPLRSRWSVPRRG